MKLKTQLTLSISLLVLLVVLAVSLIYLAGVVRQQMRQAYSHADFLSREIYNEISQELMSAHSAGLLEPGSTGLQLFFLGLRQSQPLATLFSSAIGYNGVVRDVALVAPDGTVVVDSNPLLEGHPQPQRRLMSDVIDGGLWSQVRAILGPETIYNVSLATDVNDEPLGTIDVGVDTVLLRNVIIGRVQRSIAYAILILVIATALAWGLSGLVLRPLGAISAQLEQLTGPRPQAPPPGADAGAAPPPGGHAPPGSGRRHTDFGVVSSQIQLLGRQMEDARQVYSALQENVGHVLESLDEGLMLFDAEGQVVMASAAIPRLLALSSGEITGRRVEQIFASSSGLDRAVRAAVREKRPMPPREVERHAGGRPLLARVDPVRERGGRRGALLTLRDAGPLYKLENELEVARRLSAVGRLTRGVAHEVKNPLNAMAIHLDLMGEKAGTERERLQPHIQVIRREIDRLDRVVRTFLDFSRPVELHLEPGDLAEVVRGVGQLVSAEAAAKEVTIEIRAAEPGPRVWLDRDLVEQAVLNLVNNGLQAMEQASPPAEEAATAPSRRRLWLEAYTSERQGLIRVRDQGPGIPPEDRDKIFDLYFTTRSEGSGIGLATAARIMQLHHGAIELESSTGGASFLLRFPLRSSSIERPAFPENAAGEAMTTMEPGAAAGTAPRGDLA